MGKMLEENVDVTGIYKEIYRSEGLTQAEVAEKLGMRSQAGVGVVIKRGATLNNLWKLIQAIGGYRLVVEKVSSGGRTVKRYIIGE